MDNARHLSRARRPLVFALAAAALLLVGLGAVGLPPTASFLPAAITPVAPLPPLTAAELQAALERLEQDSRTAPPPSQDGDVKGDAAAVKPDRSKLRCALQDSQYFHEEVWGAALYSLASWGCDLSRFHMPYKDNFDDVTKHLWEHEADRPMQRPFEVIGPLERGEVDLLFITSGDDGWIEESTMNAIVAARRTQVVVILHQMENFGPERKAFVEVARQGRLTFAGLGESTVKIMSHTISEWAMEDQDVAWDKVPVELFIPIFPVPYEQAPKHHKIPSRVVIQGKVEASRRNYVKIIQELSEQISANPAAWGYRQPTLPGSSEFEPIPGHPDVFTLHLLGSMNEPLQWPEELNKVIVALGGLAYDDYYKTLVSMDLLLPAFAGLHYLRDKTSSSIPAAVLGRVPVLASALALKVYEFLLPPAIVPYPAGLSEVQSIKLLREEKPLWDSDQDLYVALNQARHNKAPSQVNAHWESYLEDTPSLDAAWDRYHRSLYLANEQIWERTAMRMEAQRRWLDRLEA